jgi:mono/diheme cytochrome c family protein
MTSNMTRRLLLWLFPSLIFGADARTVLDGVYAEAQARRGEAAYQMNCAGCHGEDLTGRAMGPLRGDRFLDLWREDSLNFLFTHIRTRMPANAAGSLPETTYLDILAYILQVNTFPSGTQELSRDTVEHIRMVGKNGPQPLPTNALVRVVGCMTQAGNDWTITQAAEPVRTHDAEGSTPEELKEAAEEAPGSGTLRLQNLEDLLPSFHPDSLSGHRIQVKGVLIRQPNRDRINVISIESVASGCGQ